MLICSLNIPTTCLGQSISHGTSRQLTAMKIESSKDESVSCGYKIEVKCS